MSTILVVDDDRTMGGLLKTLFELEGHQAVILPELEKVVATARQVGPNLILMDVYVGKQDSLLVLRELKADGQLGSIPVVMTSGLDRSGECFRAGADGFLLKPFWPDKLLETITPFLG